MSDFFNFLREADMVDNQRTPEIDVLCATFDFLMDRNVMPYQISTARGAGIDSGLVLSQIYLVAREHKVAGRNVQFDHSNSGPDIIGVSETEWWQVECKGTGTGKSQTQRNNFDRALASVVSYYCEKPEGLPKRYVHYNSARPYLGLALPSSTAYLNELKRRVRQPLRKALNLWILLYQTEPKKINALSPDDNY
jgi:hypothetical protein